jgi:two-component system nitrogen regulation sensor histidine kinase GlnL
MNIDYEKVWMSIPLPSIVLNADDIVVEVNPPGEGFLNASSKSLKNRSIWELINIGASLEESYKKVKKFNSPLFVTDVKVGANGREPIPCNIQIAPIIGLDGSTILLIAPREIAGRISQSKSVKAAAKSAIGMAEMLAHEIKNPLAGITGAAQLLSMGLSTADLEITDLIVAETRRILTLLEQVEQFGNLKPIDPRPLNIHDVIDRARRSAQLGFSAHITFKEEYDPSLPLVYGDPDQLLQVFLNLIKNASEAQPNNGTIKLHTYFEQSFKLRRADGSGHSMPIQVEVMDNGPGVSEEIRDEIFDPFVSGRNNGTGLGLALTSKIISDHNGLISLDSKPGNTVFRISLPFVTKLN